jgi:hypothetical protein
MLDRDPLIAAFDAQNNVLAIEADDIDVAWGDARTEVDLVLVAELPRVLSMIVSWPSPRAI